MAVISERADQIVFDTLDPTVEIGGQPAPAMTTMLFRVCKNDEGLFNEAMRLVGLFIEEAIKQSTEVK